MSAPADSKAFFLLGCTSMPLIRALPSEARIISVKIFSVVVFPAQVKRGSECYHSDKGDYSVCLQNSTPVEHVRTNDAMWWRHDQAANCVHREAYRIVRRNGLHPWWHRCRVDEGCAHEQKGECQESSYSEYGLSALGLQT